MAQQSTITTMFSDGGSRTWKLSWLNLSPGNTKLTPPEWSTLLSYVLDGAGLREKSDDALGKPLGDWYRSVIESEQWGSGRTWGMPPSNLEELTTSMIMREVHKTTPHIFAGLKARAPLWAAEIEAAGARGDSIGVMVDLLRDASTANAMARAAEMMQTAKEIEAAGAQAEKASRESALGYEEKKFPVIPIIIAAAILIAIAIIVIRRRGQ